MVIGLGNDITECARIQQILEKHGPLFLDHFLTAKEKEESGGLGADSFDPAQILQTGIHDAGKIMEPFQQTPGDRLDIAPLDGIGEQQFQHVVIRQAVFARVDIPVPQPLPVTAVCLIHRSCPFFKFKNTKKI